MGLKPNNLCDCYQGPVLSHRSPISVSLNGNTRFLSEISLLEQVLFIRYVYQIYRVYSIRTIQNLIRRSFNLA
jgi:hypothetical protein